MCKNTLSGARGWGNTLIRKEPTQKKGSEREPQMGIDDQKTNNEGETLIKKREEICKGRVGLSQRIEKIVERG